MENFFKRLSSYTVSAVLCGFWFATWFAVVYFANTLIIPEDNLNWLYYTIWVIGFIGCFASGIFSFFILKEMISSRKPEEYSFIVLFAIKKGNPLSVLLFFFLSLIGGLKDFFSKLLEQIKMLNLDF